MVEEPKAAADLEKANVAQVIDFSTTKKKKKKKQPKAPTEDAPKDAAESAAVETKKPAAKIESKYI